MHPAKLVPQLVQLKSLSLCIQIDTKGITLELDGWLASWLNDK